MGCWYPRPAIRIHRLDRNLPLLLALHLQLHLFLQGASLIPIIPYHSTPKRLPALVLPFYRSLFVLSSFTYGALSSKYIICTAGTAPQVFIRQSRFPRTVLSFFPP